MLLAIDVTALTIGQIFGAFSIVSAVVFTVYEILTKIFKLFMKAHKAKTADELFRATVERHTDDIQRIDESQTALKFGMQALLKNNLKLLHKEYMERGSIESDELDNFITQYKAYHDGLGGNGTGTKYYEDVLTLQSKD